MHIAYVDDSGDARSFALAAVLVPAGQWLEVHDRLVDFRREMARRHDFRMRHELKATEIVSRGGPWRKPGPRDVPIRSRLGIYRAAVRELADMAPVVRTLAVVVPDRHDAGLRAKAVEEGWEVLLERLERFCFKESTHCLLMPDEGNPVTVRRLARRKRRFGYAPPAFGGPARSVPFKQLVDDPAPRNSAHSYLMQWADLVAYAAFRRVVPAASFPEGMWDGLGDSRLGEANSVERSKGSLEPPGLIVWPSRLTRAAAPRAC